MNRMILFLKALLAFKTKLYMVTVNTFPLLDRNALDLDLFCDSYCEMIRNQTNKQN